jgi:hypothetical protein
MQNDIPRAASMGVVFGAGGGLLIPVLLVTGAPLMASAQSVAVAAYMALVPMFLGYLVFGYGLTRVRPSTATTLTLTSVAVAAVLAVIVLALAPSTSPTPGSPRPARHRTEDDIARARLAGGESVTAIAAHLGVGRSTLYRALQHDASGPA